MRADLGTLESAIGYRFRGIETLVRALTHKSRAYEDGPPGNPTFDNEQLEFLGDSILGFIVSEWLVRRYPTHPEGRLSKLKAHLVSANHLFSVAQRIGIGDHMLLGRGEELSGGRKKKALVGDALEAVLAAIYLDGGVEPARAFVEMFVLANPEQYEFHADFHVPDYKSALKERARILNLPRPAYSIITEDGPEHCKTYTVEVRIGTQLVGRAEGPSKKSAGQKAAELVLRKLAVTNGEPGAETSPGG
jgi:ribonuclease-3